MSTRQSEEVPPDQGSEDTLGHGSGLVPERVLRRSDYTDALPFRTAVNSHEYEATGGTPSAGVTLTTSISASAERYNMRHLYRGICLVLNHEECESNSSKRGGTDFDVERIKKTFTKLEFRVDVRHNLNYCNVKEEIERLGTEVNHKHNDCVCVFVLSHAKSEGCLMALDFSHPVTNIWKPFTADNCPTLAGKPKLFFFQSYGENQLDSGVNLVDKTGSQNRHQTDSVQTSYTMPTLSDFLLAQNCADGCVSWRSTGGSTYIQTLCDVIDEYGKTTDLLKMLTITARRVATGFQSSHDNTKLNEQKEAPSVVSTLTRDLYFETKSIGEKLLDPCPTQ